MKLFECPRHYLLLTAVLLPLSMIVCWGATAAQSPGPNTGVLRLRVRVKTGATTKGLARKRFYLIRGSLEQNQTLITAIDQREFVSRDCYYHAAGASRALIDWLKENDCESVYCREIDMEAVTGPKAVPEFASAFAVGEKQFSDPQLARKWLTTNIPEKLREGFYKQRQVSLQALITQVEQLSGTRVLSGMTDRNGTAYFTDLEPGAYVLSNLLPTEIGDTAVSWNCEVQVKVSDLATEKPYQVSNRKDKNVKCAGVERPLPVCGPKVTE
ncbi:MAG: hypothetical protein ABR555_06900 [Pyrinomonadaceae bacterium]